jgi:hypothetical protein
LAAWLDKLSRPRRSFQIPDVVAFGPGSKLSGVAVDASLNSPFAQAQKRFAMGHSFNRAEFEAAEAETRR